MKEISEDHQVKDEVVIVGDSMIKNIDRRGEKNLWSTPLDYSMEYFWTTFGPLLEYPIRVSF